MKKYLFLLVILFVYSLSIFSAEKIINIKPIFLFSEVAFCLIDEETSTIEKDYFKYGYYKYSRKVLEDKTEKPFYKKVSIKEIGKMAKNYTGFFLATALSIDCGIGSFIFTGMSIGFNSFFLLTNKNNTNFMKSGSLYYAVYPSFAGVFFIPFIILLFVGIHYYKEFKKSKQRIIDILNGDLVSNKDVKINFAINIKQIGGDYE